MKFENEYDFRLFDFIYIGIEKVELYHLNH